jgi:hypothetical protein
MDELIRIAAPRLNVDSQEGGKKLSRRWDDLCRCFPGHTGKQLHARWNQIKNHTHLEYPSLSSAYDKLVPRPPKSIYKPRSDTANPTPCPAPARASSSIRISATRNSSAVQLRSAASASLHTPVPILRRLTDPTPAVSKQQSAATEYTYNLQAPGPHPTIVIHVSDEMRHVEKDFVCRKDVLVAEMAYFRTYISSGDSSDDIDISVHCDIHIFEWLVHYLQDPLSPPKHDTENVISILISSQFLKIERLVDICIACVLFYVCRCC